MKKNKKNTMNSTIHQYADNPVCTLWSLSYDTYLQMVFWEFWIENSKEIQATSCQMNIWLQLFGII